MSRPGPSKQPQSDFARSVFSNNLRGEDAYARHVRYITQFQNVYGAGGVPAVKGKTEMDGLVERHRFLRDDDDKELGELTPEDRIAVKYYRGLFKEFALFALRWRSEPEVLSGLGQFTCGNTRCAYHQDKETDGRPVIQPKLVTLELPFGYVEDGEAKQALVKVVLCPRCKKKLLWKRNKEKAEEEAGGAEAGEDNEMETNRQSESHSRRRTHQDQDQDQNQNQSSKPEIGSSSRHDHKDQIGKTRTREHERSHRRSRSPRSRTHTRAR